MIYIYMQDVYLHEYTVLSPTSNEDFPKITTLFIFDAK